ncbi:MAG TPA: glycosyltransferase [Spirillospora sp.]|nr:glycosyltransferase [Spirillospora sp.]
MRILMLTPALPYPPHQGGALRNFGLIHGLHAAGHQITLLSFAEGNHVTTNTPLAALCQQIEIIEAPARSAQQRLRDMLVSQQPDLALRLVSREFRQCLIEILQSQPFDLVQFEGLEMAGYLPIIRQYQPATKLCYDAHNAEFALQQGIFEVDLRQPKRWPSAAYSFVQARRIARYERDVCQQVDCVLAVSAEDAASLQRFRHDNRVYVIPNGIFVRQYEAVNARLPDLGPCALIFTGKMDYRPNVDAMLWFASDILPQVRSIMPDVRLYVVGQKPHPRLEVLRDHDHIVLTGWVPEVTPYLHAAAVYIAPLRMGSGTRLKILEAMAAGCAIVATTLAAAGLPDEARRSLMIVDDPQQMAGAIVQLLQNAPQRAEMGAAAQAAVYRHYDWSVLIPDLLRAYQEIGLG